jgi:hypothetical protein
MISPPPIRGMHKICIIKKPFAAELFEGGRSCPGNKLPPYLSPPPKKRETRKESYKICFLFFLDQV